jgi:hypothetical protein
MVPFGQLDTHRRPVVAGGDIEHPHLPADRTRSPVRVVDLDLALIDDSGDDRYVPERHAGIRSETQDAACLGFGAPVIEARCRRPPMPGIAEQPYAGQGAREWHALRTPVPGPCGLR